MNTGLWAMRMTLHPKQMQEFRIALQLIQPIMTDPQVSREEKRKTLCMMVDELSDGAFKLKPIVEQIMTIINMEKNTCEEYPDSKAQVEGILGWLPRMRDYRDTILCEVMKHRKGYGLKI